MIVLVAGPSGSGKSTIATAVATQLGLRAFCLDDYFLPRPKLFVDTASGKVRTFERPASYAGATLARDLAAAGSGVAEGFCLFAYPEVMALSKFRFFIDVPFSTCIARRAARRPQRPSDRSFTLIGETETAAFVRPQQVLPGVVTLDGSQPVAATVATIVAAVRARAAA